MTHTQKRGLCWLLAILMTAAMMTFVLLCTNVTFAANDDSSITRAFLGYETGEPARTHLFIHGLIAWPLGTVSAMFPGVPLFTYLQLAFLALGSTVIAKSIMQAFLKYRQPLLAGAMLAAAFQLTLCLKYVTFLTFTQTAALLGAAACAQILSIEHDRGGKRVIIGMMGALALVCLSYALRQNALLPMLGFCGLLFVLAVWEHYGLGKKAKRSIRPMLVSLVVIAVALAAMVGVRQLELNNPEMQDYLQWQEANTELMDYANLRSLPQEALDLVGWDENDLAMAERWCFLSPDISAEAFQTLTDYMHEHQMLTTDSKLQSAIGLFTQTANENIMDMHCLYAALLAAGIALVGAVCKRSPRLMVSVLGSLVLAVVMICYLAWEGRLPLRALLIAALPCAAICFALLPACLGSKGKWLPIVVSVLVAAAGISCAAEFMPGLLINEEDEWNSGNALTDLEEYAVYEPESLFLYDMSLTVTDSRAFPSYPDGVPNNVTFWGGWPLRSPQSIEQFANYDIDLMNFEPQDLLRENVYVASATIDPPPEVLLNWLREEVSPTVECELYSEYGYVYIFQFCDYEWEEE